MKQSIFLAFLLFAGTVQMLKAQSTDLKEAYVAADSYFLFEEYNEALPLYNQIHRAEPDNNQINYKIGICLLNDPYQVEKSIRYLQLASRDIDFKYKENSFKETSAPPEVYFYLGNAYLVNNKIDLAIESYQYFLEILDEKLYDVELVKEQINICERAKDLMSMPVDYDNVNLGELFNSRFAEKNPIVSGDGNRLVYVAERQFYDATFFSEKVNGEWQAPRNIIPELGVDRDVYPTSLSYDGNTMIIYRNDEFIGNLYVSKYVDGQWTKMEKLGPNINTKYWESHGTLSRDGRTLYFTSNRKGGFGGLDIYKSELQDDGTWGEAVNLGEKINSPYNEETPFLAKNENILYFSSYGHYNMGGYDIFYSIKDAEGEWDTPINLGYPINTTDDDLFFFPMNNGNNAYYAQYLEGGYGRHDIYFLTIYSEDNPRQYLITGTVAGGKDPLKEEDNIMIYLIDIASGDTTRIVQPDLSTRSFEIRAPKGDYDLLMRGMKFRDLRKHITIDDKTAKTGIEFSDEFVLEPEVREPKLYTGDDSKIVLKDSVINTNAPDSLIIPLSVQEGSILIATRYLDSTIVSIDTIKIDSVNFNYTIPRKAGNNKIVLKMIEENGDTSTKEIAFEVERSVTPILSQQSEIKKDSSESAASQSFNQSVPEELYKEVEEMMSFASPEVQELIKNLDFKKNNIDSKEKLFQYLQSQESEDGYTSELKAITNSNNRADMLLESILPHSSGELRKYLENIDLDALGISTASELIEHLKTRAHEEAYTEDDLKLLIQKTNKQETGATASIYSLIQETPLNKTEFLEHFMEVSPESTHKFLKKINFRKEGIESLQDLVTYLIEHKEELNLSEEQIQELIPEALVENAQEYSVDNTPALQKEKRFRGLRIAGMILISGLLIFIILFFRRKKKEEEKE